MKFIFMLHQLLYFMRYHMNSHENTLDRFVQKPAKRQECLTAPTRTGPQPECPRRNLPLAKIFMSRPVSATPKTSANSHLTDSSASCALFGNKELVVAQAFTHPRSAPSKQSMYCDQISPHNSCLRSVSWFPAVSPTARLA